MSLTEDPAEDLRLPKPLLGREVAIFLEPYGYLATTALDWRPTPVPELSIRVTGHSTSGKHTLYNLECLLRSTGCRSPTYAQGQKGGGDSESSSEASTVATSSQSEEDSTVLAWHTALRLTHLRAGLHDPAKNQLGSSYKTYFCSVPFAHHLRPAGTTARLDAWCSRLAYCISSKLVSPAVAAETLRILSVPELPSKTQPQPDVDEALSQGVEAAPEHLRPFGRGGEEVFGKGWLDNPRPLVREPLGPCEPLELPGLGDSEDEEEPESKKQLASPSLDDDPGWINGDDDFSGGRQYCKTIPDC
mmetsp:Transcript_66811/g.118286  ORF Transcript_66811/g.118286 Transcript_66811/m.118286 type:complete len:303 (+) Transcript_66811:41-949(+)